jgi:tetratricopeptide (TPR) repeat protein
MNDSLGDDFKILDLVGYESDFEEQNNLRNPTRDLMAHESMMRIGNCYEHLGDYEQAIEYKRKACDLKTEIYGNQMNADLFNSFLSLSKTYKKMNDLENETTCLLRAVQNNDHYIYNMRVADIFEKYADSFLQSGDLVKGNSFYQKALKIKSKFEKNTVDRSVHNEEDLHDLINVIERHNNETSPRPKSIADDSFSGQYFQQSAEIYKENKRQQKESDYESVETLSQATDISDETLVSDADVDQANYESENENKIDHLNNLSVDLEQSGKYEEGLECLEEAFKIKSKSVNQKDDTKLAIILNNKGILNQRLGKFKQAYELLREAYKMRKRLFEDQSHPDLANSLNSLAVFFHKIGKYEKAFEFCERALIMRKEMYKNGHEDLANSLHNMGLICTSLNMEKLAKKYYAESHQMKAKLNSYEQHKQNDETLLKTFRNNLQFSYDI